MYKIVIFQVEGGRVDKNLDVAYEGGGVTQYSHEGEEGVKRLQDYFASPPPSML